MGDVEGWRRRAVTVACYRDLYGVDADTALGREHTQAHNRERDRQIAAAALPAFIVPNHHHHHGECHPIYTAQAITASVIG